MTLPVDPHLYFTFLGIMVVLVLTPGPAILFAVATGVQHGRRGVVMATAGMNAGNVVWFSLGALGLSALALAYPAAFGVLRWIGVGYILWLAAGKLWSARRLHRPDAPRRRLGARPFRDGFLVQLSNPKALLFITAVLPPFIVASRPAAPQVLLFAAGSITLDAVAMLAYGFSGAAFATRMAQPRFAQLFSIVTGALLITAAVLIVTRH